MAANVLLVLSTSRTSKKAMDAAVDKVDAAGGGKLVALFIVETKLANEVFDTFSDIGFIGDKPSKELSEAIMKEYSQRGYEELGRVQVAAMEKAVSFEPLMERGDYVSTVLSAVRDHDIEAAVVVRRKISGLRKYFSKPLEDEIADSAPCKVEFFDED